MKLSMVCDTCTLRGTLTNINAELIALVSHLACTDSEHGILAFRASYL